MLDLLVAMNLAYNTGLKARQRLTIAQGAQWSELPTPCEAVLEWHMQALGWLQEGPNRFWTSIAHADYPPGLLDLKDPPLVLFGEGRADLLQARSVGMVGSRSASRSGLGNSHAFAKEFAQLGWVVVSGLAEGIDGAAHTGALEGLGGTVAVLGCGVDHVYPKHHANLARHIVQAGGLLLSEYPPGTPPQPAFFPRRNRIIAGLSDALLVVEAALRSGSLITARVASELGRPVFAVPGSIHSSHSKGCHAMIKQGAGLAETAADVLTEAAATLPTHKVQQPPTAMLREVDITQTAGPACTGPENEPLNEALKQVLEGMGHEPLHIDTLATRAGLNAEDVLSALTELELLGLVVCEAGQRWMRFQN